MVDDYLGLLSRLIEYHRNGLDFLWSQAREAMDSVDKPRMQRLLAFFEREYPERSDSFSYQSQLQLALGNPEVAVRLARRVSEIDPTFEEPFDWLIQHSSATATSRKSCPYAIQFSIFQPNFHFPVSQTYILVEPRSLWCWAITRLPKLHTSSASQPKKKESAVPQSCHFIPLTPPRRSAGLRAWLRPNCVTKVITLFQESGEGSSAPLTVQANGWQAMHVATL